MQRFRYAGQQQWRNIIYTIQAQTTVLVITLKTHQSKRRSKKENNFLYFGENELNIRLSRDVGSGLYDVTFETSNHFIEKTTGLVLMQWK